MCPPLFEYGIAQGLSATPHYEQDFQDEMELSRNSRILRQDAENRAKLFGDMFQFGEATTTYNKQKLKEFSEGRIKEIGTYINANPDWQMNGGKYATVKNMAHGLLDNDYVKNDMAAVSEYQNLVKFIHDNPGAQDLPEIQKQLDEWKQYQNTGDIAGQIGVPEQQKSRFMFNNPASSIDYEKTIHDAYAALKYDENQVLQGNVRNGQVSTVSEASKRRLANALTGGYNGLKLKAAFNTLNPEQQKLYGNDPRNWIYSIGADMVQPRKLESSVNNPKYGTNGQSGTMSVDAQSNYDKMVEASQKTPDLPHPVNADVLDAVFRDNDGMVDISDADLIKNRTIPGSGERIGLNGQIGLVKAKSTGIVVTDNHGQTMIEMEASVPFRDFYKKMKDIQLRKDGYSVYKEIDYKGMLGGTTDDLRPTADNIDDFDFHGEVPNTFRRVDPGFEDNNTKKPVVKFKIYKPIPTSGQGLEWAKGMYNKAIGITNTKAPGFSDAADDAENQSLIQTALGKDEAGNYWQIDPKTGQTIAAANINDYTQNPNGTFTKKQ